MQKILFPVFFLVLFLFVSAFAWTTYGYYQAIHSDDPITPYLSVTSGSVTIGRGDIAIDMAVGEKFNVEESDIIMTKADTLAVLHWPDHSTTRIGDSSRATIKRMHVADDYSMIEIEILLEKGKIWNNVIRTIYPGSYFRAQLPDNNIIAGVRGTVFEINLDKSYIHSVDHSVALSDGLGRVTTLLPGDIVSASDIMKKLSQTVIDAAWAQMNSFQDAADNLLHSEQAQKSLGLLRAASGMWDQFVRWSLASTATFRDIQIVESLQNAAQAADIPKEYILKWYQRVQDTGLVEERENIRNIVVKTWKNGDSYIDAIARGAIWDKMSFSGMTLKSADTIIGQYANDIDTKIQGVLNVVPVSDLQNKAKETLRSLLK